MKGFFLLHLWFFNSIGSWNRKVFNSWLERTEKGISSSQARKSERKQPLQWELLEDENKMVLESSFRVLLWNCDLRLLHLWVVVNVIRTHHRHKSASHSAVWWPFLQSEESVGTILIKRLVLLECTSYRRLDFKVKQCFAITSLVRIIVTFSRLISCHTSFKRINNSHLLMSHSIINDDTSNELLIKSQGLPAVDRDWLLSWCWYF